MVQTRGGRLLDHAPEMNGSLSHRVEPHPKFGGQITTLLRGFGIPMPKFERRDFTDTHDMNAVYVEAKKGYFDLIRRYHPDNGGDGEEARKINHAWARVELWYKRNYPRVFE